MSDRIFNKEAYDRSDKPSKEVLQKIIETNTDFKLIGDLDEEHYKSHDVGFKKGNKTILFENEARINFETIANVYDTIHIPIRKKFTNCDYYLVWKVNFKKFILIKKETIQKYLDNLVVISCNEDMYDNQYNYVERFIDIPKEETQGYIVNDDFTIEKFEFNQKVEINLREKLKSIRNQINETKNETEL